MDLTTAPTLPRDSRNFTLDILRGLAISLVLIRHFPTKVTADEPVTYQLFQMGWAGVDLFFVLSGFLIAGLLFSELGRTGTLRIKRFLLRRGLKIWPSYFVLYLGWVLVRGGAELARGNQFDFVGMWPNFVFVQNYADVAIRWPHSWSLAIEEHFYLCLPFLLLFLARSKRRAQWTPVVLCALILGILGLRLLNTSHDWADYYYPTHLRADSLLFGVLLAWMVQTHRNWVESLVARGWPLLVVGGVTAMTFPVLFPLEAPGQRFAFTWVFSFLAIGFTGMVAIAAMRPTLGQRIAPLRWVAWLGVNSYGVYLAHSVVFRMPGVDPVLAKLANYHLGSPWVGRVLYLLASIGVGYAATRFIEKPILAYRSKWAATR